jgi:hypothetical protein
MSKAIKCDLCGAIRWVDDDPKYEESPVCLRCLLEEGKQSDNPNIPSVRLSIPFAAGKRTRRRR